MAATPTLSVCMARECVEWMQSKCPATQPDADAEGGDHHASRREPGDTAVRGELALPADDDRVVAAL